MTPRRHHHPEVVRLRRRPLASPLVQPEPVDVVAPAPATLVRRLPRGGLTASELAAAVRGEFQEARRCR